MGLRKDQHADEQQLIDWTRDKVGAVKRVTSVDFADSLPKPAVGKVLRRRQETILGTPRTPSPIREYSCAGTYSANKRYTASYMNTVYIGRSVGCYLENDSAAAAIAIPTE